MMSRNARAQFRSNKMNKSYDITTMPKSNARNSNSGSSSEKQVKQRQQPTLKQFKNTPL